MTECFLFEVRLLEVDETISRRFLLNKTSTFHDLHRAIQDACSWEDCHLFAFRKDRSHVIASVRAMELDEAVPDASKVELTSYFGERDPESCLYEYDFGDGWLHEVKALEIEELPGRRTRRLLAGEGTFPPEDCGGVPGYYRSLAAATGKGWTREYGGKEERAELKEWLDGWKPERFDLAKAKKEFDR